MPDCVELPAAGDRPHSISDATMHAAARARPNNVCAPPIVGRATRLAVVGSTSPAARGGLHARFIECELALRRQRSDTTRHCEETEGRRSNPERRARRPDCLLRNDETQDGLSARARADMPRNYLLLGVCIAPHP